MLLLFRDCQLAGLWMETLGSYQHSYIHHPRQTEGERDKERVREMEESMEGGNLKDSLSEDEKKRERECKNKSDFTHLKYFAQKLFPWAEG